VLLSRNRIGAYVQCHMYAIRYGRIRVSGHAALDGLQEVKKLVFRNVGVLATKMALSKFA
jgi:hypothetical protein